MKAEQSIKRNHLAYSLTVVRAIPKSLLLRDNLVWHVGAKQTASLMFF
jgi:hypothetical protein